MHFVSNFWKAASCRKGQLIGPRPNKAETWKSLDRGVLRLLEVHMESGSQKLMSREKLLNDRSVTLALCYCPNLCSGIDFWLSGNCRVCQPQKCFTSLTSVGMNVIQRCDVWTVLESLPQIVSDSGHYLAMIASKTSSYNLYKNDRLRIWCSVSQVTYCHVVIRFHMTLVLFLVINVIHGTSETSHSAQCWISRQFVLESGLLLPLQCVPCEWKVLQ